MRAAARRGTLEDGCSSGFGFPQRKLWALERNQETGQAPADARASRARGAASWRFSPNGVMRAPARVGTLEGRAGAGFDAPDLNSAIWNETREPAGSKFRGSRPGPLFAILQERTQLKSLRKNPAGIFRFF